ncbi:hypothetical protein F5Y09DRAFT_302100 [Xylaria sp. FL1042]|nr:hypothetical protein F5Y09DRAFT_302100 [Xylaria sp. FL1042]
MAPAEAERCFEIWHTPENFFAKQGYWLNGGSLPSRSKSSDWNQLTNRRFHSLPPCYITLTNIRFYLTNKPSVERNEEMSLKVIPSDGNEQDSATSQLGTRSSFQRVGRSPYFQQPDEHAKIAFIYRWLQEISGSQAELEACHISKGPEIVHRSPWATLPPVTKPVPFPVEVVRPLPTIGRRMPRLDEHLSSDTQDSVSIPGSAAQSLASGGSRKSFGSYHSFGSRKGRRIEFDPTQAERALSNESSRKRGATGWQDQQRIKKREGSTSSFIHPDANNNHWHATEIRICLGNDTNGRQWCAHGFQNCWQKPKEHRTFYRKDSLQQHISLFHMKSGRFGQADRLFQLDDWVEEADVSRYDLKCYFCGHLNDDWHRRARHIISHFDDGWTIDKWTLARDWALFPPVSGAVRELNSKPPNIYESLLRPVEAPSRSRDDTWLWSSGPIKQRQFHEERNIHHPSWIRQGPIGDEWWCGLCRPGRWMPDYDRASWDEHMMFTHGISTIFENLPCPGPLEVRLEKECCRTWQGLCMFCRDWIALTSDEEGGVKWFRHAAQCWKELVGRCREVPIHITSHSELQVLLQHQLKPIQDGPIPFCGN